MPKKTSRPPSKCQIIKGFLPTLVKIAEMSEKDGREAAVTFCQKNGRLFLSDPEVGNEEHVSVPKCREGKAVSAYHTHPSVDGKIQPLPSVDDQVAWTENGFDFLCIGTANPKGEVRCFSAHPKSPVILVENCKLKL